MFKMVITSLDSSNASGCDCISEVVLKKLNSSIEQKCLKESCFPNCWKVSTVVPVFKNVLEKFKNHGPLSLLSVVGLGKTCK